MATEQAEQLREAAARLVMGWRTVRIPWAYSGVVACWETPEAIPIMTCHAWRPDEDDVQCMQVVDRMVARGYVCSIVIKSTGVQAAFGIEGLLASPVEHTNRRIGLLQAALAAFNA